jgi:hypothetical protein
MKFLTQETKAWPGDDSGAACHGSGHEESENLNRQPCSKLRWLSPGNSGIGDFSAVSIQLHLFTYPWKALAGINTLAPSHLPPTILATSSIPPLNSELDCHLTKTKILIVLLEFGPHSELQNHPLYLPL